MCELLSFEVDDFRAVREAAGENLRLSAVGARQIGGQLSLLSRPAWQPQPNRVCPPLLLLLGLLLGRRGSGALGSGDAGRGWAAGGRAGGRTCGLRSCSAAHGRASARQDSLQAGGCRARN